ncbi:MAG: DUF898 family protein [Rubrivivax sp.]
MASPLPSSRPAPPFYGLYAKGLALAIVGGVVVVLMAGLAMAIGRDLGVSTSAGDERMLLNVLLLFGGMILVMWIVVWPYFAARTQQIVWGHTRFAGRVGFAGQMRGWTLWKLVAGQTLLTLLTAGLYWPFAAVAIARYRLQSLEVVGDAPLPGMRVEAAMTADVRAMGDAAADLFGLDLGW